MEKLSFPISWFHGGSWVFSYVAKEKKFFQEEGLDVSIVQNLGSKITSEQVGSGEYAMGIVGAEKAMIARSKGLPIKVIAVVGKVNPSGIVSWKKISNPKNLEGEKVGVILNSNSYQMYSAFLLKNNINRDNIFEMPVDGLGNKFLKKGVKHFVTYPFLMAGEKNKKLSNILFYDYGLKSYGLCLVANSDYAEKNPKIVQGFTNAILKGMSYERKYPKESFDIMMKQNPQLADEKDYQKKMFESRLKLDERLPLSENASNGVQSKHDWIRLKDILTTANLLEGDVDIGEFFTNKFVNGLKSKEIPKTISAERVFKSFSLNQKPQKILKDVNFSINEGEFVTILGESGCGKSTFLNILSGLDENYEGKVDYEGKALTKELQKKFSFVTQSANLLPWKTLRENVVFFAEILNHDVNVDEMIEEVGLTGFENHYPHQLSGGMKQRVAIARALITRPHIVFLDEPFGALDYITRYKMNELIMNLCKKHLITIVMVTHNIDEAILLSDRIFILKGSPAIVKKVYDVPFPRPRTKKIKSLKKYNKILNEIQEVLS